VADSAKLRRASRQPYSFLQWEDTSGSDVDFSFLANAGRPVVQPNSSGGLSICDVWFARPVRAAGQGSSSADRESGLLDKPRRSSNSLADDGTGSKRGFKSKTLTLGRRGSKYETLTLVPDDGSKANGITWAVSKADDRSQPREAFAPLTGKTRPRSTPTEPPPPAEGRALPPHFFTANSTAGSGTPRQSPLPAPQRVHDFHNAPFDPSSPMEDAPSVFRLPRVKENGPTTRRRQPGYSQFESLQSTPPAPPSALFQSASRPLYFNPAARRTAYEISSPDSPAVETKSSQTTKAEPEGRPSVDRGPESITLVDGTPDETWAQYVELTPAGFPSALLAGLFDSQASHDDPVVRRERIVNVALRASVFDVAGEPQLGIDRLRLAFEAGLETAEAHELLAADYDRERSLKLGHREDMAVILREIWRPITDLVDKGDDDRLTWASSRELLWRWVGLVAWTGPESLGETLTGRSYVPAELQCDRVEDLAVFLDKIGAPADRQLEDFGASISRGWVNEDLVKEIQWARQRVIDVRRERDETLVSKDKGAREKLWSFLRDAYDGRQGLPSAAIEGWVETLLAPPKPDVASSTAAADQTAVASGDLEPAEGASLGSRWTSAMLLVGKLVDSQREPPASCLWHLCDALRRLKSSDGHQVPLANLRAFTSIILRTRACLDLLAPRQHYDLLLEFIAHEDLAFAKRLYHAFRIRERSFAFSEKVSMALLKLALGLRQAAPYEGETEQSSVPTFAGAIYDDRMAWGAKAIKGKVLLALIYSVGRDPKLGGLATRILADSIAAYGPGVITDDVAMSISQSARDRVLQAAVRAVDPKRPPLSKQHLVTASSAFCVLPLIRGLYRELGRPPPVKAFNQLLELAALHPTPYNTQAAISEFTTMMNHGPLPDLETFNILIRMHLGIRSKREGFAKTFDQLEPCEPQINLIRAITLFKTMVVRQGIQPDQQTFTSFLQGLLSTGQPAAAYECFRHAVHLKLAPSNASTLMLVRALVDEGQHEQANSVVDALESLKVERATEPSVSTVTMEAAEMKSLSDTVLSTILPTLEKPQPAQFHVRLCFDCRRSVALLTFGAACLPDAAKKGARPAAGPEQPVRGS
jgi:hypothetical protein